MLTPAAPADRATAATAIQSPASIEGNYREGLSFRAAGVSQYPVGDGVGGDWGVSLGEGGSLATIWRMSMVGVAGDDRAAGLSENEFVHAVGGGGSGGQVAA